MLNKIINALSLPLLAVTGTCAFLINTTLGQDWMLATAIITAAVLAVFLLITTWGK